LTLKVNPVIIQINLIGILLLRAGGGN
jgi:hypothetical protein